MGKQTIKHAYDNEHYLLWEARKNIICEIIGGEKPFLYPNTREMKSLLIKILSLEFWKNQSSETNTPPDFYWSRQKLMMDVMKVSEFSNPEFTNRHGIPIDQQQKMEGQAVHELIRRHPNLPSNTLIKPVIDEYELIKQKHTYEQWLDAFKRVVGQHNEQIETYQENHPGYATILFIYDMSNSFGVVTQKPAQEDTKLGKWAHFEDLHCWYKDKSFIDYIATLKCDYIAWCTPRKTSFQYLYGDIPPLPPISIFKVSECKNIATQQYDPEFTISLIATDT